MKTDTDRQIRECCASHACLDQRTWKACRMLRGQFELACCLWSVYQILSCESSCLNCQQLFFSKINISVRNEYYTYPFCNTAWKLWFSWRIADYSYWLLRNNLIWKTGEKQLSRQIMINACWLLQQFLCFLLCFVLFCFSKSTAAALVPKFCGWCTQKMADV